MCPVHCKENQLTIKNMKGMETTLQYHRTVKLRCRHFLRKTKYFTEQQRNACGCLAVSFLGSTVVATAGLQTELFKQAEKTEQEPHLVETGVAPLMPPKICWFTLSENDQVEPGETAYMPSKGGEPCLLGVWLIYGISLKSTPMKKKTQSSLFL